jgi:hypothetical protein
MQPATKGVKNGNEHEYYCKHQGERANHIAQRSDCRIANDPARVEDPALAGETRTTGCVQAGEAGGEEAMKESEIPETLVTMALASAATLSGIADSQKRRGSMDSPPGTRRKRHKVKQRRQQAKASRKRNRR